MSEWILGVGASHNGGACLLADGKLVVAIQEERLTRVKRARLRPAFDTLAIRYCLDHARIDVDDLALVAVSRDEPVSMPESDISRNPLFSGGALPPVAYISHHRAHAAAALFQSGFDESAVLVIDGLGSPTEDCDPSERAAARRAGWETLSIYHFMAGQLTCLHKDVVPDRAWLSVGDSGMARFAGIGGMYSAVARQLFGEYLEAGKVMGLAPYGRATFAPERFYEVTEAGELVFRDDVPQWFCHDARWPEHEADYADLAASVQAALEQAVLWASAKARSLTGSRRLAYSGGVALNCLANERIIREAGYDEVFVMPAAEDSGTSIGAAVAGALERGHPLHPLRAVRDATGRRYSLVQARAALAAFPSADVPSRLVPEAVAQALATGAFVGWFCGGAELGPRALGGRSILADPRRAETWPALNRRKGRESFRPLAPVVLAEHAEEWFEMGPCVDSPFMLRVCSVREQRREQIPAVVHIDGTARVQTLAREANPRLHAVLSAFHAATGVPVLVNTSFNAAAEPIVETPEDALWCAARLGLELVALDDIVVALDAMSRDESRFVAVGHRCRRTLGEPSWAQEVEVSTPWGTARYWLDGLELQTLRELAERPLALSAVGDDPRADVVEQLRRKRLICLERPS
jgi:carbamoyltransferase